jgi:uncharacterized membrane protein YkvA (DUF1232 family)
MNTAKIRKMIEAGAKDEAKTGRFADLVRKVSPQATEEQVRNTVTFVREYAQHVPLYMEQATAAAAQAGLAGEMQQMTAALQSYWDDPNDLIPDRLGLVGLMDDAYASMFLLQAVSDYCRTTFGRPLLEQDLKPANQLMRNLIGEPVAPNLEARVGITIGQAMMQRMLQQLAAGAFSFGFGRNVPDPIWGNASIDDIVKARMGAMGIV